MIDWHSVDTVLLEVLTWKLSDLDRLIERDDVTEARVIAALLMAKRLLEQRG